MRRRVTCLVVRGTAGASTPAARTLFLDDDPPAMFDATVDTDPVDVYGFMLRHLLALKLGLADLAIDVAGAKQLGMRTQTHRTAAAHNADKVRVAHGRHALGHDHRGKGHGRIWTRILRGARGKLAQGTAQAGVRL